MFSSRLTKMISIAFNLGFLIRSNCHYYDKTSQRYIYDSSKHSRIKLNAFGMFLFLTIKPYLIWQLRQQNNLDLYNLTRAFYFGGFLVVSVYGLPTFYAPECTQCVNGTFLLFRYLQRKFNFLTFI